MRKGGRNFSRSVSVFDTTLRDGEQAPGIQLSPDSKLVIARALEETGVDVIEAGFPVNSPSERKSVEMIAKDISETEIAVLCRPIKEEINLCHDILKKANRSRLHLWIATSPIHMKYKLNMSPGKVMEKAISAIRHAAGKFDTIQFSSEDATRSDLDFLTNLMREAARAGVDVVNLADTVGCALPEHMALLVREIRNGVKDKVPVGVHCHNDLNLATANTISSIRSGARQVDVTVTGIGERAGNTALEQLSVALLFHEKHFGITTNIRPEKLGSTCDTVINEMNLRVGLTQPLVGDNAFRHESGIHVHGMLNNPMTYELVDPKVLGLLGKRYILGKHTGKSAVKHFLNKKGCVLPEPDVDRLTELVKERSTDSGPLEDENALIDFALKNGFDLQIKEER
jgi:2-isopropylmalate synthase